VSNRQGSGGSEICGVTPWVFSKPGIVTFSNVDMRPSGCADTRSFGRSIESTRCPGGFFFWSFEVAKCDRSAILTVWGQKRSPGFAQDRRTAVDVGDWTSEISSSPWSKQP